MSLEVEYVEGVKHPHHKPVEPEGDEAQDLGNGLWATRDKVPEPKAAGTYRYCVRAIGPSGLAGPWAYTNDGDTITIA
ncbi:hypothetical protein [Streptomyces narbonensis]|uniref:hypothetical protein n=1 Tax=Streptomyces narbonensis TaxID=67333 RepID=UPI0033CDD1BA